MRDFGEIGEFTKALGFAVFIFIACGYFFYAATQGPSGLFTKSKIEAEAIMLETQRDVLLARRIESDNRIQRMSDEHLDLDLLDQQARKILGYIRRDEVILN